MKRTAIAPFRLVSPGPAMTAGALRRLSETPGTMPADSPPEKERPAPREIASASAMPTPCERPAL